MRKNNLIPLLLVLGFGCTKALTPQTLISRWEKTQASSENVLERKLASSRLNQNQCLKDVYSVDVLRSQVKDLEKKFQNGTRVTGFWKHINLSQLPIPQANFLKSFGDKLGDPSNPDAFDFRGCSDVPCLYNRIYQKENHVAGYVHYLWYLKFGNMLSADNVVPAIKDGRNAESRPGVYNGKLIPFEKFLYNDSELYALWRLTLMLDSPFTNLPKLKEVQRIPRGENIEGMDSGVCGLAASSGWIVLNDGCLGVTSTNWDQGYLYSAVTHEMSHQVDYELGRAINSFYRSQKSDYYTMAGFVLKEWHDTDFSRRVWDYDASSKSVTRYARNNPVESFAETAAYYRVDANMTKNNVTPEHYAFIKSKVHQDVEFDKTTILNRLIQKYNSETGKDVFKAVIDCSEVQSSPRSVYFSASDFTYVMTPAMLNCIGGSATDIANLLKARIAINEAEGCSTLNEFPGKSEWDGLVKKHLTQAFSTYLAELNKDEKYLARIKVFYEQLSNKKIAQDAYINCYGEMGQKVCFDGELKRLSYENAAKLNLPPEQTQEMADMYVSYHSYESIASYTKSSYQALITSNLEMMRTESSELWGSCRDMKHNDNEPPTGRYLKLGDGYLVSSFYNCLNAQIPTVVKDIVRGIQVEGQAIQHAKEELILIDEVTPRVSEFLTDLYKVEKNKEIKAANDFISGDRGALRQQLLSDFSWVKNIVDSTQITSDCKREAYNLIPLTIIYNLKKDLFGKYVEENSCRSILESPEFNNWVNGSKDNLSNSVMDGLETKMLEMGTAKAQQCLRTYPIDSALNKIKFKKQREDCLMNDWVNLEGKLLEETLKDPVVLKFKISPDVIKQRIELNRRRLQLRVIKDNFN